MILTKLSFFFLALALGNQMKIQTYDDCGISICEFEKVEMDSDGNFWPKYCYQCPDGEEEVIFLREYTPNGWRYAKTKESLYQGRLILDVLPCDDEEVDSMGNRWETWCFDTGDFVSFEKLGENNWEYKQDYTGGYGRLQFRRILDNSLLKIYKKPLEVDQGDQDFKENTENISNANNLNITEAVEETKNAPAGVENVEIDGPKSEDIEKPNQNTIKNEEPKLKTPENQPESNTKDEFSSEIVKTFTANPDSNTKHNDLCIQTSKDSSEVINQKKNQILSQKQLSSSEPHIQSISNPKQKSFTTEIEANSKESDNQNDSQQSFTNKKPISTQPSLKTDQKLPEPFLVSESSTLLNTLENSETKDIQSDIIEEKSDKDNQETDQKSDINNDDISEDLGENDEEKSQSVLQEEITLPYIVKIPLSGSIYEDYYDEKISEEKIVEKKNEVQEILEKWLRDEEKDKDLIENDEFTLEGDGSSPDSFEGKKSEDDNKLNPCSEIEGDKSGRYFYVDYDEKGNRINYQKDENRNFIFDTDKQQRLPEGFLSLEPVVKDRNSPCPVYDFRGKLIELEPDMYIKNLFWQVVYENGIRVKFMKARLSFEKLIGSYLIDPNTGYRYRSFI